MRSIGSKKLSLAKMTLRRLNAADLKAVAGGTVASEPTSYDGCNGTGGGDGGGGKQTFIGGCLTLHNCLSVVRCVEPAPITTACQLG